MSDITLVDINELVSTISKDKDMLFVVEVPSGGGFIQRKITKEQMFKLLGQAIDLATSAGQNDLFTFDGGSNKITYFNNGSTGILYLKLGTLGLTADGSTNVIQMSTDGSLRLGQGAIDGNLTMIEDSDIYDFSGRDLEQNVIVDLDIQDAATTEAVECRSSIAYLEVDAGGTIASHTIQFPQQARVGYTFEFYVQGTITALTLDGGAATIDESLTTVTNGGGKWVRCVTGTASWRRVSLESETSTPTLIQVLGSGDLIATGGDVYIGEDTHYAGYEGMHSSTDANNYTTIGLNDESMILRIVKGNGVDDDADSELNISPSGLTIYHNYEASGDSYLGTISINNGRIYIRAGVNLAGNFYAVIDTENLTQNRNISFPDIAGTLLLKVQNDDIEINDPSSGLILQSPDNTRWRVTVDNTGTLVTTSL